MIRLKVMARVSHICWCAVVKLRSRTCSLFKIRKKTKKNNERIPKVVMCTSCIKTSHFGLRTNVLKYFGNFSLKYTVAKGHLDCVNLFC